MIFPPGPITSPIFSVSIAYVENGRVELGSIYDPMQDEYFYAERGAGAWLNGQKLLVIPLEYHTLSWVTQYWQRVLLSLICYLQ